MNERLFVANLPFVTSEAELQAAFSPWGGSEPTIPREIATSRGKGYGFIEVAPGQSDAAIAAMHGQPMGGRLLTVEKARRGGLR